MRVTIKDVAEKTGYSITTVSQVLNNRDINVTEETKKLIRKTAEEMNYRPNQLAVNMTSQKSNVIGLIVPDIKNPFFNELSTIISETLKQRGYSVFTSMTSHSVDLMIEALDMFVDYRVDGCIIVHNHELDVESIWHRKLYHYSKSLPIVIVDGTLEHPVNQVGINNKHGGYAATRHLFQLGHTQIGCLAGPNDSYTSNQRILGYRDCLLDRGIEYDDDLVMHTTFSMQNADKILEHFLKKEVSAIFALNDQLAMSLYKSIKKKNLRIPEDLSIVGFDNIKLCEVITPPLTTINQPITKMAKSAVEALLLQVNEGDVEVVSIQMYQPNLIERKSTQEKK